MNPAPPLRRRPSAYLMVLLVVITAFVGVMSAMQVLVLTSVATTSRAFDGYRQASAQAMRFENAVAEALLSLRQVSVATPPVSSLLDQLDAKLGAIGDPSANVTIRQCPSSVPAVAIFPDPARPPDPLANLGPVLSGRLTPELVLLAGQRAAIYPPVAFEIGSERPVLDRTVVERMSITAQLVAVPLTRFPIAAYELPSDIAEAASRPLSGPPSTALSGLVPGRISTEIDALRRPHALPYLVRRRATLATAYQFVFSQAFADRLSEYAGVTHYRDLDQGSGAVIAGLSTVGATSTWDLGMTPVGSYGSVTALRDAAVVVTESGGRVLRLHDSLGDAQAAPLVILLAGPSRTPEGPLDVRVEAISRPVVIIGWNVRINPADAASINGALFLDPASSISPGRVLTVRHFSYWAGTSLIPAASVVAGGAMPPSAEILAPRVVYVAASAIRL